MICFLLDRLEFYMYHRCFWRIRNIMQWKKMSYLLVLYFSLPHDSKCFWHLQSLTTNLILKLWYISPLVYMWIYWSCWHTFFLWKPIVFVEWLLQMQKNPKSLIWSVTHCGQWWNENAYLLFVLIIMATRGFHNWSQ